jgi:hypothetical protein
MRDIADGFERPTKARAQLSLTDRLHRILWSLRHNETLRTNYFSDVVFGATARLQQ